MEVIYTSKFYILYQSGPERCFYLDIGQKTIRLSFCQFLALRQKVMSIYIEDHFDPHLNKHGLEILVLCNKEHFFILNTLEVLDLKCLIDHSFSLIEMGTDSIFVH
ncbi:hypothetical protein MNBD_BACTEROID03-2419 [hydrothermal vent metagenome]|uniref:Uncharacterized protein n=1 Tax=hydrothermal vent metagenome TaxID=652676 RepID=A0A3B0TEJ6_9ZZZZ